MLRYDLSLDELWRYRPALTRPKDFAAFWAKSREELRQVPVEAEWQGVDYPADGVRLYAVTYAGFGGTRVHAWYAVPARTPAGRLPGLVVFHGYDWSVEGGVHEVVNWGLHGYATLAMLTRGQQGGGEGMPSTHGHSLGWMTQGILDPATYYYRAVYMDAVRAVDIAPEGPYLEIRAFLRRNGDPEVERRAMTTLAYHDVMNLAPEVRCPALVGIGLEDAITPPSTVFAAYHHLAGPKDIRVYRFFGHEEIPRFHGERLAALRRHLLPDAR